ncbi:pilus assembly protein TadG-related protein [Streptomyces boninensis]|uniref:pilus assembly protein TadG-related protein n=1 Tax=Streptomyces boninensis TaxID=2039455 RepID=UPI003B21E9EC
MRDDRGQAFPIYIAAIGALLFLAVAYFAVGQAAATRNDAQGAADAAALAAAQDARDQLGKGLLEAITDPGQWGDIIGGEGIEYGPACAAAQEFAAKNDADTTACDRVYAPDDGFKVSVRTKGVVGDSLVPGTEDKHAEATATAVIESKCKLGEPPEEGDEKEPPLELECDGGGDWTIDPGDLDLFPKPSDLFSVHLVD